MMDFIYEQMGVAVLVEIVDGLNWAMIGEPDVVQGKIDRRAGSDSEGLLDVLKNQSRLTGPFRPLYAQQIFIPIDLFVQISVKTK